jgi:hypothetical protein
MARCREPFAADLAVTLDRTVDSDVFVAELGISLDSPTQDDMRLRTNLIDGSKNSEDMRSKVHGLLNRAQEVFRNIGRAGFSEDPDCSSIITEAFRIGTKTIASILSPFESFMYALRYRTSQSINLDIQFDSDRILFCDQFARLYGDSK